MARFTWRSQEELTAAEDAETLARLRVERDRLLAASDWTQLPDAPLTSAQREAWAEYRAALRDLPELGVPASELLDRFPTPPA